MARNETLIDMEFSFDFFSSHVMHGYIIRIELFLINVQSILILQLLLKISLFLGHIICESVEAWKIIMISHHGVYIHLLVFYRYCKIFG